MIIGFGKTNLPPVRGWMTLAFAMLAIGVVRLLQPGSLSAQNTVICSTTQIADFTRQIVGDHWVVLCVLAPGEDPHTYEVGNDDLLAVKRADLCLENGWNLEGHAWMRNLAATAGNRRTRLTTSSRSILAVSMSSGTDGR